MTAKAHSEDMRGARMSAGSISIPQMAASPSIPPASSPVLPGARTLAGSFLTAQRRVHAAQQIIRYPRTGGPQAAAHRAHHPVRRRFLPIAEEGEEAADAVRAHSKTLSRRLKSLCWLVIRIPSLRGGNLRHRRTERLHDVGGHHPLLPMEQGQLCGNPVEIPHLPVISWP